MKLSEVDLIKVYRLWKRGLGEFRCFFRSSPFVSLKTYEDFEIYKCDNKAKEIVLKTILEECNDNNFVIVDLPFSDILDLSIRLNNNYEIKPILGVNLLFNDFGLVGDKMEISKLITYGLNLKKIKTDKFVMMINYNRYMDDIDVSKITDKLNNQYEITEEDLPDLHMIKSLGYNEITIISRERIKQDLKDYIEYMKEKIDIKLVKVD